MGITKVKAAVSVERKAEIAIEIAAAAGRHGMVPHLGQLVRQCRKESSYDDQAYNAASDCCGLFQLSAATARELGVDRHDWRENIEGGVKYMAQLVKRYGGDYARALAAYNWGMGHLAHCEAYWGVAWRAHLPLETQHYLAAILLDGQAPA